jgi:hypothetical protein
MYQPDFKKVFYCGRLLIEKEQKKVNLICLQILKN